MNADNPYSSNFDPSNIQDTFIYQENNIITHLVIGPDVNEFIITPNYYQIKYLYIHNNYINPVNFHLAQLTQLESLIISSDKFEVFPNEIGSMKNLNYLELHIGAVAEISDIFSELHHLKKLILGLSTITTFPPSFFQLKSLESLWLAIDIFHLTISSQFKDLTQLQQIILHSWNSEETDTTKTFVKWECDLGFLTNLKRLRIELGGRVEFQTSSRNLPALEYLECIYCYFPNNEIPNCLMSDHVNTLICIGCGLEKIPNLSSRSLKFLNFKTNQISKFPNFDIILNDLRYLDLSENKITNLSPFHVKTPQLQRLIMNNNLLTSITEEIVIPDSAKVLDLSNNKLQIFSPRFRHPNKLEILKLFKNQLTSLTENIYICSFLKYLNVSDNNLVTLPSSIKEMNNLVELNCYGNKIRLKNDFVFPSSLEKLSLFENQLDLIPISISNLSYLREISLNRNKLNEIPPQIRTLTNLCALHLDKNQFRELSPESQSIIQELDNQKKIVWSLI